MNSLRKWILTTGLIMGLLGVPFAARGGERVWPISLNIGTPFGIPSGSRENIAGLRLSALFASHHDVKGLDIAGLVNQASGEVFGLEFAGLVNEVGSSSGTLQISGLANNCAGDFIGAQLTSIANDVDGTCTGIQLSCFNLAEELHGIQIGVFNHAGRAVGMQLGVFNDAELLKGIQIGVFNFIHKVGAPFLPIINIYF